MSFAKPSLSLLNGPGNATAVGLAAVVPLLLGLAVLAGWHLESEALVRVLPSEVPTEYNTALGMLFSGAGLLSVAYRRSRPALALGLLVTLLGVLTVIEFSWRFDLGIDTLWPVRTAFADVAMPERMSAATALCFMFTGLALVLAGMPWNLTLRPWLLALSGSLLLAFSALSSFGGVSGITTDTPWGFWTRMGIPAAAAFGFLGVGFVVCAWAQGGLKEGQLPSWRIVPVGIGVLTASLVVWQAVRTLVQTPLEPFIDLALISHLILLVGLLLAVLLAAAMHLAQAARRRARETHAINLRLERQIAEHRATEAALRQSEELYRTLVESLPQRVFYKNVDSVFVSVNIPFAQDLGMRPDEVLGKSDYDLFPKELAEKYRADDRRILAQHRPETLEEINIAGGIRRDVEVVKAPVFDPEGEVIGLLGIFTDITDRKHAQDKLRAYAIRLQRSNCELQDFAYVASHDLQEPLRKVTVFGDRLKKKYGDLLGAEGKDYLDRMLNASGRMQGLINDLLKFSRVTTQAHPFVAVDLHQIACEVISDLEARIEQVHGRVEVGPLPQIDADATQMRQLLQNLVGNALKFRRPEAPPVVRVQARLLSGGETPSGKTPAADSTDDTGTGAICQLTVEDNGIGFDEQYVERIFHVFQRLHSHGEYEGTGMGLAICRKIAERHGGEITAHSVPGRGSTFVVTLPVRQTREEYPV